ncbi:MAG: methyl-accepting chemotaxis protein [Pedobacter sp.]
MYRMNALARIVTLTLLSFLSGALLPMLPMPTPVALLLGCVILALLILLFYWQPHQNTLAALSTWVTRLGAGDLTAEPPWQDGLHAIADDLTGMGIHLDKNIAGFILAANQVCLAGAALGSCAEQAATNASSQADQTDQISSAAEQVSVAIRQIASTAESVSAGTGAAMERARIEQQQAIEAQQAAQSVLLQTENLGTAIRGLGERLSEISGVVTMIRGVANQTNLLALNASIEAARAGVHGRGFAVVADEVKSLAAHTLAATDDIASRIQHFQQETATTVNATAETLAQVQTSAEGLTRIGQAMSGMVDSFSTAHAQVDQITQAVREQQHAIQGLTSSIEQVAELAGEMNATARGVHEEARSLTSISDELLPLLGGFRLSAHEKARKTVTEASCDPDLKSMQRDLVENILRQQAHRCGYLELLYVTDNRGRQVTSNIFAGHAVQASYGSDGCDMDWSQRPWFRETISKGSCTVTPFYRSAATHRFCFTVAAPIHDSHGRIGGVLGADIDVAALLNDR